jgi:polysaccharide biosynthesis/export protein
MKIMPTKLSGVPKALVPCLAVLATITWFGCFNGKPVQTEVVADMPPPAEAGSYKIGSDDVLDILVWQQKQLSGPVRVASDGSITLPLIGRVEAAGLTANQLQADLTKRLSSYVHDPRVTVRVSDPKSRVFYVLGEVTKPGTYPLMSGEVLSQALATAGGPTEYANLSKIKIIRRTGDKQMELLVDYGAVSHGDLSADVPLKRGDTVMVP